MHGNMAHRILHVHVRVTCGRLFHNRIDVACEVFVAASINVNQRSYVAVVSNEAVLGATFKAVDVADFLADFILAGLKRCVGAILIGLVDFPTDIERIRMRVDDFRILPRRIFVASLGNFNIRCRDIDNFHNDYLGINTAMIIVHLDLDRKGLVLFVV